MNEGTNKERVKCVYKECNRLFILDLSNLQKNKTNIISCPCCGKPNAIDYY